MMTLGRAVKLSPPPFKSSPTPVNFLRCHPLAGWSLTLVATRERSDNYGRCHPLVSRSLLPVSKHLIYNDFASQQRCLLKLINLTNFVLPTAIVSTFVGTLYVTSPALN